jgi:hypothetical protein
MFLDDYNFTHEDRDFLLSKVPQNVDADDYLSDNIGNMIQRYQSNLDCILLLLDIISDKDDDEAEKLEDMANYDVIETLQYLNII